MIQRILFYLIILSISIAAQMSELVIRPHHISFTNQFERIKTVRIVNHGTSEIRIDSIQYNESVLYVRKRNFSNFPFSLAPDSTISINVILTNYFVLQGTDTSSTISIFNNSPDSIKSLNVYVNYERDHRWNGIIRGSVKDSSNILPEAKLYFFYDGIYLIDSTTTDANGDYEKELRRGNYFVAALKDGYYMQYGNLKSSPLNADFIEVRKDTNKTVNFILEPELETDLSISGVVFDIVSDETVNKAIVVVRKGKHTPTKVAAGIVGHPNRSYSVMANSKGEYVVNNIKIGGDYYVEAFSQYYIPGYYNRMNEHRMFWQEADSVDVVGSEMDKNIYLDRDSSYGGGVARGHVRINNNQSDSGSNSLIFALSTLNDKVYSYNFSQASGKFNLPTLPSGTYKLITDKIGYENSVSSSFVIDTTQDTVANIDLVLLPTSIKQTSQKVETFRLSQNYPNPFNPSTTIEFALEKYDNVTLTIYNSLGQKVAELINGNYTPGTYKVVFNASQLSSGIYIYQLSTSTNMIAKKMELLK
ncbi:MAG: T9SS type A sorting domain-containing protein [Melioribacteraceae bacterium]|nr:T9SS type A sorting domain-containing protein [Melioribacteraceae bacterium]